MVSRGKIFFTFKHFYKDIQTISKLTNYSLNFRYICYYEEVSYITSRKEVKGLSGHNMYQYLAQQKYQWALIVHKLYMYGFLIYAIYIYVACIMQSYKIYIRLVIQTVNQFDNHNNYKNPYNLKFTKIIRSKKLFDFCVNLTKP